MKSALMLAGFVLFTVLGNFFFKRGAMELAPVSLSMVSFQAALGSKNVWFGVICYGLAAVLWFVSLSLVPLNLAITVSACVYVIVVLMAALLFNEPMSVARWAGVAMIFSGLVVIGKTL